jgi:hypothetical protein
MVTLRDDADSGDVVKLKTSVAMQIVAWIVGILITYSVISARVAVVESKQNASDQRIERIENKLDRVLELMNK